MHAPSTQPPQRLCPQVGVVQRDFDRSVGRLEQRVTDELDRRLPPAP